jgi:regulator of protease activity HflC (stomatin/prohibitin superfamily)
MAQDGAPLKIVVREKEFEPTSGWFPLVVALILIFGGFAVFLGAFPHRAPLEGLWGFLTIVAGFIFFRGLIAVPPNTARVLLLFGVYHGSVTREGFYWVNPFYSKKKVSLRVRNFETGSHTKHAVKGEGGTVLTPQSRTHGTPSKVNDRDGNPIDISAVVVWRVQDTAEALFEVDDYEDYLSVQSESALRVLASRHPYDSQDGEVSLRASGQEISDALRKDIQERLDKAGIEIVEARISHLAYSPEIAAAMLQRQQAKAMIAARTLIVDGAVGIVEMALERITRENVVVLDDDRRAAMVSNLLVVLCGGGQAHPVINTGTIYSKPLAKRYTGANPCLLASHF